MHKKGKASALKHATSIDALHTKILHTCCDHFLSQKVTEFVDFFDQVIHFAVQEKARVKLKSIAAQKTMDEIDAVRRGLKNPCSPVLRCAQSRFFVRRAVA